MPRPASPKADKKGTRGSALPEHTCPSIPKSRLALYNKTPQSQIATTVCRTWQVTPGSAAPRQEGTVSDLRPARPRACLALPRASSRRRSCPASDTLLASRPRRMAFMRPAGIRCSAKTHKGRRIEYNALSLQQLRLLRVADGRAEAWRGPCAICRAATLLRHEAGLHSLEGTFCHLDLPWPEF